nr:MAG TPA: hypothetical protein [Caudoviricetes sp.]
MLDTNPKLKQFIDALIDKPNVETKDIVQPIIKEELKKARMIGVEIGFQSAMIQAYDKIKNMQSADEIKVCLRVEADAVRKRMGLNSAFDDDGNLIVDVEESGN